MEGFEPSRRLPDLPHFECGPFSHLGTSPYGAFFGRPSFIIHSKWQKVNSFSKKDRCFLTEIMTCNIMKNKSYTKCRRNEHQKAFLNIFWGSRYDMSDKKKAAILEAVESLTDNYRKNEVFTPKSGGYLPNRSAVIDILRDLRAVIFPGYFGMDSSLSEFPEHYVGYRLNNLYDRIKTQVEIAFVYRGEGRPVAEEHAERVTDAFIRKLPWIQSMLLKDIQAGFDGDPAAKSKEEIICSYPGLFAIYVYRLAHELYLENVPFIPRIMTEYAHGATGIDINPGAVIGEYFFIDHGTGVVIGETTVIGNYVKLYQGVTLGALSTRKGQQLAGVKRHPTIEDHVTIYSNSTVLGGETVIGEHAIVAGNTFVTESIPAYAKVNTKSPELVIRHSQVAGAENKNAWFWEI